MTDDFTTPKCVLALLGATVMLLSCAHGSQIVERCDARRAHIRNEIALVRHLREADVPHIKQPFYKKRTDGYTHYIAFKIRELNAPCPRMTLPESGPG